MIEAEWNTCTNPFILIECISTVTERKGKLFVVGCCRQCEQVFGNRLNRNAILSVEKHADGLISSDELFEARGRGRWGYKIATACSVQMPVQMLVILTTGLSDDPTINTAMQCHLLRDVFGNPYRSVVFDFSCLTKTVKQLAEAIYDERAFDRLPILADALEEAGCTNADILNHCRQPGVHVRGCWVVDLLLNKS